MQPNCLHNLVQNFIVADTHAHLDREVYKGKLDGLFKRALQSGLKEIWLMSISQQSFTDNIEIIKIYSPRFPELKLRLGLGLDMEMLIPNSEHYSDELPVSDFSGWVLQQLTNLEEQAKKQNISIDIVGEIGIDHYWLQQVEDKEIVEKSKQLQESMFRSQLEYAARKNLPVSIHSRAAEDLCISIVMEFKAKYPSFNGVFHSFTGTKSQMQQIIELGFYVGINGIITFKSATQLASDFNSLLLPESDIINKRLEQYYKSGFVLETDSPFLIPSNADRKDLKSVYTEAVNEPAQIINVLKFKN